MRKSVAAIVMFLLATCSTFSQDFSYKFCLISKDATTIALEFTVCNNTTTAVSPFTIVFNWPGVSDVTVDNNLTVIKNGNGGVVEFEKPAATWIPALTPGCNNKYTVRMKYELGMFPPATGTLNGVSMTGTTCYVPPGLENFKCKKNFSELCFHKTTTPDNGVPTSEIRIGEGSVWAWGAKRDAYIPTNRKGWAIGMAVAHTMFTNLMGFECLTINEYFATTMQETNCGCDPTVTAPAWATNLYPDQSAYCFNKNVAVGYFQQELQSGWVELSDDIPCFIPTVDVDKFVVGAKFETQAIAKVYQDYNNIAYWQYIKCWNPIGFLKNCKDPYAAEKIIAFAYNRGMNAAAIGALLTTDRAAALTAPNLLPHLSPTGVGWVYAEQISRMSAVLDNNFAAVNPADATANSVVFPGVHSFRGFYDTPVSWADISNYIDAVAPMYAAVGLNAAAFKSTVQKVFNGINGGADISFRYKLAPVIDAIVLNLPAFDPKFGLGKKYMNSGGLNCKFPTAALSKSDTVCPEAPLVLTVKLTGTPPWSFSYQSPKGATVSVNNISTSPYIFTVKDTGTYHLLTVSDATGVEGEAICEPIIKAYFKNGALADLVTVSTVACGPRAVQIKFTGKAPYDIEYTKDGVAQTPVNGITQNPYTLVAASAPVGTYVLTRLKANGCDVKLADTAIVHPLTTPKISIKGNTSVCEGQSTLLVAQSTDVISTYSWLPVTDLNVTNNDSVTATPKRTTKYVVTATDVNGCTVKDSVTVNVSPQPKVNAGRDTTICINTSIVLTATGGNTYKWTPADGLSSTTAPSVTASPKVSTQYIVTGTSNGCSASDTVKVNVISCNYNVVATGGKVCEGACITLKAVASGGTAPYTYSWLPGGTTGDSVKICPVTPVTYTVTVTDFTGKIIEDTAAVTVNPLPATTVNSLSVCKDSTGALTASGAATYNWMPGNTTGATKTITATTIGTTTYTITGTSAQGCTKAATAVFTVVDCDKPTVAIRNASVCAGTCYDLLATTIGGTPPYSYKWVPDIGKTAGPYKQCLDTTTTFKVIVTDANSRSDSTTAKITVHALPVIAAAGKTSCAEQSLTLSATGALNYNWQPGNLSGATITLSAISNTIYTVTGTDVNGCSSSDTALVTVNPKPVVIAAGNDICTGNPATLNAAGAVSYLWMPGNSITNPYTVSPAANQTYTVTGTDAKGCTASASVAVKVNPKPIVTVNSEAVCTGTSVTLTAGGAATYSWSSGETATAITITPVANVSYTVTGTTAEGCSASAVSNVTVKQKPVVSFTPDTAGCIPLVVKFNNFSTNMAANATCSWDFGNGIKSDNCSPKPVEYNVTGSYSVSLTVNNDGCSVTVKRACVTVHPSPKAFFTANPPLTDLYNPTIVLSNESSNMNKSVWLFDDGSRDSSNTAIRKHTYEKVGNYHVCLNVSNVNSCVDQYCVDVIVNPVSTFFMPNAFTPDDFGKNNTFNGKGENINNYKLMIFNRWGAKVFESNSLNDDWDGRINNGTEIAQADVYVYMVSFSDFSNKHHEYVGTVTLIK